MTRSTDPLLGRRLRRANRMYPGWHVWASSSGHIYATGPNPSGDPGAMATVDAPDTARIGQAISAYEAETGRMARTAARYAA